ncbi:MAG: hypothetical protein J6M93_02430 [Succinivibrio sp.]|nr:hypothetical protein [Succinivibrio sp.]
MKLTEAQKEAIRGEVTSMAVSGGAALIAEAAAGLLKKVVGTNMQESDLSGNKNVAPTEDSAVLDEKKAEGNSNEGALAKDNVKAQGGDLAASQTDAEANQNEAKAMEAGAKAMQTGAGAMEVATKAMKIN